MVVKTAQKEMVPLKPQQNVTIYSGQYNEKMLAFIPSPVRKFGELLDAHAPLQCANHVVDGSDIIQWGCPIVLVMWPLSSGVKRKDGSRVYGAESFCCVTCQRSRAMELKVRHAQRRR